MRPLPASKRRTDKERERMQRVAASTNDEALPPRVVSPLETLTDWLGEHPDAFVGAVTPNGQPAPMPGCVELGARHQTDERSLLALIVPEDTKAVTDAFFDAVSLGVGMATIHMVSEPTSPLLLRYVDLRQDHGVLVRVIVAGERAARDTWELRASTLEVARPRLGLMTKDEFAAILSIDVNLGLMLGWADVEMVGRRNLDFIHPDDHVRAIDNWMSGARRDAHSVAQTVRLRYLCKDGSWLWLETSNEWHTEADGPTIVVARLFDVSEEMAASEALRRSEEFLRRLTDTVPVGLFHMGHDGDVAFVNPVLRRLIGGEADSQSELAQALLFDQAPALESTIARVIADARDEDLEVSVTGGNGAVSSYRINVRAITDKVRVLGVLGCVVDVTELRSMADTDGLTGLENRRCIWDSLAGSLDRNPGHVATIYLDLDDFKLVNDRYGHLVGDQLLVEVSDRLRAAVRSTDEVGRLGGDEFLVVCSDVAEPAVAMALANRIQTTFEEPFHPLGHTVSLSASLGVAYTDPDSTADQLVSRADSAMYEAKRCRHGRPELWRHRRDRASV
jgi:diguanylate cyclase (GGDEF)-like protein/PAS domain S-box-containing protein